MRTVFLALLAANLLFLAWASWIDNPLEGRGEDASAGLPRLQLVSEAPLGPKPGSDLASKMGYRVTDPVQTCTSIGPFNDIDSVARVAGLLSRRGLHLQQRAEEGETIEGYWVFVGGMQSDEDVARVLDRLASGGVTDAHVMKRALTNRRVSVGMFSTRERAEKRAATVKRMGLEAEIGEREFPGTVYWVDVALASGPGDKQQIAPEYALADIGHAKIGVQPCPAELRPGEGEPRIGPDGLPSLPRTKVATAPTR